MKIVMVHNALYVVSVSISNSGHLAWCIWGLSLISHFDFA